MDKMCTRLVEMDRFSIFPVAAKFISQKVFITSFYKSQFPHKSVNSLFVLVMIKDKLTDLCVTDSPNPKPSRSVQQPTDTQFRTPDLTVCLRILQYTR